MIISLAISSPGGIIRWREAEKLYIEGSPSAAREAKDARLNPRRKRNASSPISMRQYTEYPSLNYHMGISRVFQRHFTRVEGIRGYYVLNDAIGGDVDDDVAV